MALLLAPAISQGQTHGDRTRGDESGLAIPRFVSLGSDKVNVRTGPGVRYPISWQFVRSGLPVEVIAEFDFWRKIRDQDGAEGWVHKNMLSGRRMALVQGKVRTVHVRPDPVSPPLVYAEPGVQVRLLACDAQWCEIDIAGYDGFIARSDIWGVYKGERIE